MYNYKEVKREGSCGIEEAPNGRARCKICGNTIRTKQRMWCYAGSGAYGRPVYAYFHISCLKKFLEGMEDE